ncbi:MAG: AbiV family abortive infection protein [Bacteroidetes bacterium]|nr:AbiV family abortive infection protein [Bacteroidota bacterium]
MNEINANTFSDGIDKSLNNAKELLSDALLLNENNRKARAHALLNLCKEEIGKLLALSKLFIETKRGKIIVEDDLNGIFRGRDAHKDKIRSSLFLEHQIWDIAFDDKNDEFYKSVKTVTDNLINNVQESVTAKEDSLYVSFKRGKFFQPSELISEDKVSDLIIMCALMIQSAEGIVEGLKTNLDAILKSCEKLLPK